MNKEPVDLTKQIEELRLQNGRLKNEIEELHKQRDYRELFENAHDAIIIFDPETEIILEANNRACEIYGFPKNEFIGMSLESISQNVKRGKQYIANTLAGQSPIHFETVQFRKDGSEIFLEINAAVVNYGNKKAILSINRDITERRKAEVQISEMLVELQRSNKELEQFAYIASHDLQEPLRMISGYTQLLEKRYGDKLDETAKQFIEFAVDGTKRMNALIQDLLAFSRVTTRGKPFEKVSAGEILNMAVADLAKAIEESHSIITIDSLPEVYADPTQLRQLFQNLLSNAIKFRKREGQEILISARDEQKDFWTFFFKDNGIGIDPRFNERIFQIFQRLHTREDYPGTGIGLALCKRIVERHGGNIWVESQPDDGATFYFTLPKKQVSK